MPASNNTLLLSPLHTGILTFIISLIFTLSLAWYLETDYVDDLETQALTDATNYTYQLESSIIHEASIAYTLATLVNLDNRAINHFDEVVATILPSYPYITDILIVSDGIVRQFYSTSDEANLQNKIRSIPPRYGYISKRLTITGPFPFKNNKLKLAARLPVFIGDSADAERTHWGYVEVGISLTDILEAQPLESITASKYHYKIWRQGSEQDEAQLIYASSTAALNDAIEYPVRLSMDEWRLGLVPVDGWHDWSLTALHLTVVVLVSSLLAYLAASLHVLRQQDVSLQAKLAEGNAQIDMTQMQLEATFDAIPDPLWLKDINGVYINCNHRFEELYGDEKSNIIGRTDYDYVSQETADAFRHHDLNAIEAGITLTNQEWLTFAQDGYRGLFETVKTPLRDYDGNIVGVIGIARDISEHYKHLEKIQESEMRLQITLESTKIGIWEWDVAEDAWFASPTYHTILGYPPVQGLGDREKELAKVHPDDREMIKGKIGSILDRSETNYYYEARLRHADGHYRWVGVRGKAVEFDESGKPNRIVGVRMDIDERRKAEEQMNWLAHNDALTGLPNRISLKKQLTAALNAAKETGVQLAVLFIDLDNFKNINDALGHSVGDALLQMLAQRMQEALEKDAIVSRQGGDEFIAVLPHTDTEQVKIRAKALIDLFSKPCEIEHYELFVTPSIGISLFPDDGDDHDMLLKCSDLAMYSAKNEGRNNFQFYSQHLQANVERTTAIEAALRRAIEQNELRLVYQPQVELRTNHITGVEALLRWQHPTLGHISPVEFIPIAEDSGQIIAIGEWVLRTAAKQMRQWLDNGMPLSVIAVNLSALQFRHPNLLFQITKILDEEGLPPYYLELELTERVAMYKPEEAIDIMQTLNKKGIRLSIDDFGTGYSSLSYLKRFPISKLKIDRSFVSHVQEDSDDRAIISTIIDLANNLGLMTIAEGVENEQQLEFLRMQGCNEVQGYFFSPPTTSEEIERMTSWSEDV